VDKRECGKFSAERYDRLARLPVSVADQQWETNSDILGPGVDDACVGQGLDAASTGLVATATWMQRQQGDCVDADATATGIVEIIGDETLNIPNTLEHGDAAPAGQCASGLDVPHGAVDGLKDAAGACKDGGAAAGACKDGDAAAGGRKEVYQERGACNDGGDATGARSGREAAATPRGRDTAPDGDSPSPTHRPAVDLFVHGPRFHHGPIHAAVTQPQTVTASDGDSHDYWVLPGCLWTFEPPDQVRVVPWYGPGHPPLCWVLAWGAYVQQLAMHGVWELNCAGSWTYRQLW